MGYTVLYIAFGAVALWLLGEVFLQNKARLRWRLLTFVGFLCVAVGVMSAQVLVIVLGAIGFGAGQALVTLSHRRGFVTGWAIAARPAWLRGRDDQDAEDYAEDYAEGYAEEYADPEDDLTAPDDLTGPDDFTDPGEPQSARETAADPWAQSAWAQSEPLGGAPAPENAEIYSPTPLPDETGEYGVYADTSYPGAGRDQYATAGYGSNWQSGPQPAAGYAYDDDVFAKGGDNLNPAPDPSYADPSYAATYGQQAPQQQPYQSYESYDSYNGYDSYAATPAGYAADPYATPSAQYQPQQDYPAYQQDPYAQDPYQQQSYGYPGQPAADGWNGTDPYNGQQPYVPQQTPPGYEQEQDAEGYQNYQQYDSYQPYGY